jgi:sugar lactone lactonase YvrE
MKLPPLFLVAALFLGCLNLAVGQTATLFTVEENGPRAQRINLVFLSEGYTTADMPNFATHVNTAVNFLFTKEPWQQYRSYCNVYRIEIASNQSGCDNGNTSGAGGTRDTYFNAGFNTPSVTQLLTLAGNGYSRAYNLLNTHVPEYDVPVVIVNDTKYGGAGGGISVASVNGSSAAVVEHEIGHSFAGLADEYDTEYLIYTPGEEPNNTAETNRALIRWNYWIEASTPVPTPETATYDALAGLFEGSMYRTSGWYRPHNNSLMRSLNRPCGQINREQFVLKFYERVSLVDARTPVASTLNITSPSPLDFAVTAKVPSSGPALQVTWAINGTPLPGQTGTSFSILSSVIGNGAHTVTATLQDPTPFVRRDTDGLLNEVVTWNLNVSGQVPIISEVANQVTDEDTATAQIPFTVLDGTIPATSWVGSATSSNQALVASSGIVLTGTGASRSIQLTPVLNQSGTTTITLSMTYNGNTSIETFDLTVNPVNDPPTIGNINNQTISYNSTTGVLAFTINDPETAASALVVTAGSSDTDLVPGANILLGGSSNSRTVSVTPAANMGGSSIITLYVSDGTATSERAFTLFVSAADIDVEAPVGNNLVSGASLSFGTVSFDGYSIMPITVRNGGAVALSGILASLAGADASMFQIITTPNGGLDVGRNTTLVVRFSPTAEGLRTATLNIASSDPDESPFAIELTGTGVQPPQPFFTLQPASRLVLLGSEARISAKATGDPTLTYQWKKGSAEIKGATTPNYVIPLTKSSDAAAYTIIADNPVGPPVSSLPAYLGFVTLGEPAKSVKRGATLSLKCTVAAPTGPGVKALYSWHRGGIPLTNGSKLNGSTVSGADKASLSIAKIGMEDSGTYTCLVTLDTPGNDPQLANGDTAVSVVDALPVLVPIPLPTPASVSQTIDETITATNFPTGFTVTGLPKGLSMNLKTGRITGKPVEPSKKNTLGAYIPSKITFKAMNPVGTGPEVNFDMVIEPLDPSLVGTFNGIVDRDAVTTFSMGGTVQVTVATTGVVSGSAILAGQKHTLVGALDITVGNNPTARLTVKRNPSTLGELQMDLGISTGDDYLSGSISDPNLVLRDVVLHLGAPNDPDHADGSGSQVRFDSPSGIALRQDGSFYVADTGNHIIRLVQDDAASTIAGSVDVAGSTETTFDAPEGLALGPDGALYVADTGNATIRKVSALGVISTFAGMADQIGSTNGTGTASLFNQPSALCFDPAGNLYVVDRGSHTIRKITPAGVVTTLAGKADTPGHKDGSGAAALFSTPRGIVYEPVLKALFVTDTGNHVVRKVTLSGTVTTYAGGPGADDFAHGPGLNARFRSPIGIATLGDGTLVVGDSLLRLIPPGGLVKPFTNAFVGNAGYAGDQPVALAYHAAEQKMIVVHDRLHAISTHQPSLDTFPGAPFYARRNSWTSAVPVPTPMQGDYNAAIPGVPSLTQPASVPEGDGFARLTLGKTGIATWSGRTPDGTAFTASSFMAGNYDLPLHAMMHGNTASLLGHCFINPTSLDLASDITPELSLFKLSQPLSSIDRSYKAGIPYLALPLFGGKYTPNDLHAFLGFPTDPAAMQMTFSESLIASFQQALTLSKPNAFALVAPVKSLSLKIDPKTGLITGSFKEGTPAITVPFAGILIDYEAGSARQGYGHYLLPDTASPTAPIRSSRFVLE